MIVGALGLLVVADLLAFAPLGDKSLDWPLLARPDAATILELPERLSPCCWPPAR